MEFFHLSDDHAVAPQISPEDVPALREAGFTTIICNRPDMENPVELQAPVLRSAVEAAGLRFVENPASGGALSLDHVAAQAEGIAQGKSLAYCASGTRCAILWALAQAGRMPTEEILNATAQAGYRLDGMRAQIDLLAARQ